MKAAKYLLAVLTGLGIYLAVVPDVRVWAKAIAIKAAGADVSCEWQNLVRYPWQMEAFTKKKQELNRAVKTENRDKDLGIVQVKTPGRSFWVKEKGLHMNGMELIAHLVAERQFNVDGIPSSRVRSGDVVVDIGAHVGTFTDFALLNGASKVVMVEPDPVNVECLRRNFAREIETGSVVLVPEGAWSSEDSIELSVGVANSGAGSMVRSESGASTVKVRVRPLDQILAELKIDKVNYIKMDIEGAEREALKGAANVIRNSKPRIMLDANHRPDDSVALPALIASLKPGYSIAKGECECDSDSGLFNPHTLFFE